MSSPTTTTPTVLAEPSSPTPNATQITQPPMPAPLISPPGMAVQPPLPGAAMGVYPVVLPPGASYVSYKHIYKAQKKAAKENKKAYLMKVKEQYKEQKNQAKEQKEACKGYVKEAVRTAKIQVTGRGKVNCDTCMKEHVPVFQIQSGPSTKNFCSMPCYHHHGRRAGSMCK